MIALLMLALLADDHGYGPVDPAPLPDIAVTREDGRLVRLRDLTAGKRTAVQFIFTHCPTACPLLGSLFGKVEKNLDDGAALLSISVDPERDTPERLAEWRRQFGRTPRWVTVRPSRTDLAKLLQVFGQKDGPPSGHALKVFYVDAQSRYVARTTELPRATGVASALTGLAEVVGAAAVSAPAAATGQALYHQAAGTVARVNGETLLPAAARCANCHGAKGEGRREGSLRATPLRRDTLLQPMARRGGPASHYSREAFCQSLRTGIDPAGIQLDAAMPRYTLSESSCTALWEFVSRR